VYSDQTDNHATFTNLYVGGNKKADHEIRRVHPLTQYLLDQNIEHKLSRPGTPQHNGFVERSHRTDEEEFYQANDLLDLDKPTLTSMMRRWQDEYNLVRQHTACGNMPPMQYFVVKWEERLPLKP
jgi:transposase InsO family protein